MKSSDYYKTPKQDTENCITDDYKEPDYIELNNFTPNVRIGEPKLSADKEQNPNNSDSANSESHDNSNHEPFCVTEKDSDYIDIDDLY